MSNIAEALGRKEDSASYRSRAKRIKNAMIERLFDGSVGAFSDAILADGEMSKHYSQHATAFALAYEIFDGQPMADRCVAHIERQSAEANYAFRMSVYGAYFLLRGLYNANAGDLAMRLMANEDGDQLRTYAHMMNALGATITTEAWDPSLKGSFTYSHPWGAGAAPAIARGMFGIRPTKPAYETFEVKFQPGGVKSATITVPTIRGAITAGFDENGYYVSAPPNTTVTVCADFIQKGAE